MTDRVVGPVRAALEADLVALRLRDRRVAESAVAAMALALADELDSVSNSATSKSMCAARLIEAWDRLMELAPVEPQRDDLDDLTRRRAERLARRSASADLPGS